MKMHFIIYSLFFLFIPFLGISQNYEHTLKEEKRWRISQDIGMGVIHDLYYVTTCDTSINSKNYFRLDQVYLNNPQYPPNLLGFVREDTIAQKVYFLNKNDTSEELIIDYTLTVGDSFININYSSTYIDVVHVDTLFMNGKYRKVIHFQGYGQGGPYLRFIEGMGNGFWGVFRNYNSNGTEYNRGGPDQGGFTCAFTTPIQSIQKEERTLSTFPNPFNNSIHIELGDYQQSGTLLKKGVIYDFTGRIVNVFEIEKNKTLSLESLTNGMYFLKIDGFKTVKIIKQNKQ